MLATVIALVGGWATDWIGGKIAQMKATTEIRVAEAQAKIALAEKKELAKIEWEQSAVDQLSKSWKDEWLTLILTIPLVLIFVPGMEIYITRGFDSLQLVVPDWYLYLLGGVFASGLGLRNLADIAKTMKR